MAGKLKRLMNVQRYKDVSYIFFGSLKEMKESIEGLIKEYGEDTRIHMETEDGMHYGADIMCNLTWYTEETDEEYEKRCKERKAQLQRERQYKNKLAQDELKMLKKLKDKYET